jgi:hypothetical protein
MRSIEAAVLRTLLYADVFDFPLTPDEIHHFLIHDEPISFEEIEEILATSSFIQKHVEQQSGYLVRAGRQALIEQRITREKVSAALWPQALHYGAWLARLPFVRMVAVTGALAMHNAAGENDDLDYMLVTTEGRVWLARAFSILLVRVARLRGVIICPNYVLSESALEQNKKDLFIAHEITQMIPIYGHNLYWSFRAVNAWAADYLPNADEIFHNKHEHSPGVFGLAIKQILERVFSGRLGNKLETWEYQRKLRRFAREMETPYSAAQLDEKRVKGHFKDYGHPVLRQYHERLREYGLKEVPFSVPGD